MSITTQLTAALAGRYAIEREIGAGGMATVYLAQDLKHDRKVALKVLKAELAAVLGAERFVQEIKTTASLQHPHILPLFDSGTADGFLFYVMPWIQGETLREKLNRETQLGVEEAVRIARDIADALDYAHRHGVIHRDIKPENILLHDGRPMVADFGIALAVSAAAGGRMTETGLSLGTPHYMSPEQATAEKEITARSDVYSLGSVLYEMLTGNPPHVGASAQQIIMKIIVEPVEPVTKFRKSVPPNVAAAVAKSLEKLPADRFESAKAFGDALSNPAYTSAAVAGAATGARGDKARVFMRLFIGMSVLAAVALVGWARSAMLWRRAEAWQGRDVHFAIPVAPNQPLGVAAARTLAVSPNGMTIVYATADSGGVSHIFVRKLGELTTHAISGTDEGGMPFFSPDGKSVAFFVRQQLKTISLDGGSGTLVTDFSGSVWGGSWSPKGTIVISINQRLAVVPVGGGALRPVGTLDSASEVWPTVLADGRTVLYGRYVGFGSAARQIAAVDLVSGKRTLFDLPGSFPVGVVDGQLVYGRNDGTLLTVPFDERRVRVIGNSSAVVVNDVQAGGTFGQVKAVVSASGSLAYVSGLGAVQLALADGRSKPTLVAAPPGPYNFPRFSPDGKRIALSQTSGGRTDVWLYEMASGALTRLTSEGTTNERPEWSPDGKRVLYRTDRGSSGTTLWWQPWDGSGPAEPLLAVKGNDIWEGVLSPDGRTVVYRLGSGGAADIWYRRLDGDTTAKPVANTAFAELEPRLSPDGRWVAYQSNESGSFQVYVRPFPGPGARTQVSVGGGVGPVWSRDGRRLYYNSVAQQILVASVTLGSSFTVTSREVLFSGNYLFTGGGHAQYDVSPDGKQILLLRSMGGTQDIVVVHDWKYELRARLAGNRQ
jgi:serine/threonine-protein kinase